MNCRRARRMLTAADVGAAALRRHLASCAECARYEKRLEAVFETLGSHHLAVTAPASFSARVRARLRGDEDALGWAALRLLPATLGLLLLLSWLNYRSVDPDAAASTDPTTAVLSWVLDAGSEGGGS